MLGARSARPGPIRLAGPADSWTIPTTGMAAAITPFAWNADKTGHVHAIDHSRVAGRKKPIASTGAASSSVNSSSIRTMSKFLAWIIVAFARSVTFPFGARRRMKALLRVAQRLKPDTISVCVAGSRMLRIGATSRASISRFMRLRQIEPDTIEWLDGLPDGPVTLWDIGANLGLYSLYAAVRSDVHVLAFKPGAASYRTLNDNIEMNAMDSRITALPVALCKATKLDVLNMGSTHEGGSMHGFAVEVDQFGGAIDTQFRQGAIGFSIDDFVQLFHPALTPVSSVISSQASGFFSVGSRCGRSASRSVCDFGIWN